MKKEESIKIRGARVHNLKNINVDIPRNKLVVITGLSGSGKSSLAFDLIYAEAERRFVESLSSYARQFLGVKEKPEVESISGLSPAIAIDQSRWGGSHNPRSTAGTITEIYDYLRILYARFGAPHCPQCDKPVSRQRVEDIMKYVLTKRSGEFFILAPVIEGKKGEHKALLEDLYANGFVRVRRDGEIMRTQEAIETISDRKKAHTIEAVVDRFSADTKEYDRARPVRIDSNGARVRESLETALKIGKGKLIISDGKQDMLFSEHFACLSCAISLPALEPRLFSFNSPYGACPRCTGLGTILEVDPDLVIPNRDLSLVQGAIQPWMRASHRVGRQSWYWRELEELARRLRFSLETPIKQLSKDIINTIFYGEGDFEGVIPNLTRRWKETESEWTRSEIERYMTSRECPACKGARLRPEARAVRVFEKTLPQFCALSAGDAQSFLKKNYSRLPYAFAPLGKEIIKRIQFLVDVGLDYLSLDRSSLTLAGGESQRVRLATQIGSGLTGVIYVLDEPSIGLHARDQARLLRTLTALRDLGNTILVVEHDAQTILAADWIIDLGPGAGRHGGKIIFQGAPKKALVAPTLTGAYLSGRKTITLAKKQDRSVAAGQSKPRVLSLRGAKEHNLKNVTVDIPLGRLVCIAGVSGSGKSTLVNDILARALRRHFYQTREAPGEYRGIEGLEHLDKVVVVDQSPIGRTPRSNPATYTGAFGPIRALFAKTQEARARGYTAGRFSFNVKGGRCEICEGAGVKKIEMYFLPDIYQECEECNGKRYNREALEILFQGKTIADVLAMDVGEAESFFRIYPSVREKLGSLRNVGLDYIKLGQPATTLSGGEAQRVKLAAELARRATGKTLYILDEPTVGLHFEDVQKLLQVLNALVEKGNTVLIIEHHLDVLRNADWIIELGPEGGEKGGYVIAEGAPQDIKKNKKSLTGPWLKKV